MSESDTPIYGIDLGTTNSCIAILSRGAGRPEVIPNTDTELVTPSVVYFESPDNIIVGKDAKNIAVAQPELVCSLVKREMSKDARAAARYSYHGRSYSPEEVSSLILRKVVGDALEAEGRNRNEKARAVITVPAYFGTIGKNATKQAGLLAELDVLYVVPEPVAAAVAYGAGRSGEKMTLLVYDLGGGTFDVAIVELEGKRARVVAFDGDRMLGGVNWDQTIVSWIRDQISGQGIELAEDDAALEQQLLSKAEAAKKSLSKKKIASTKINIEYDGRSHLIDLSNEAFEQMSLHLLDKTIASTRTALDAAKARGVTAIDRVLLVGGSCRMPAVAARVKAELGLETELHDPDQAVAKGAAILAGLIGEGDFSVDMTGEDDAAAASPETRLVTMLTPKGLGIEAHNMKTGKDIVDYIVPKNSELPASGTKTFGTYEDNQREVLVKIYEERAAESAEPAENTLLHQTPIELPPGLAANSPIEVTYRVDDAGILHVFMKELRGGKTWEISLDELKQVTDEDMHRLKPARESVA